MSGTIPTIAPWACEPYGDDYTLGPVTTANNTGGIANMRDAFGDHQGNPTGGRSKPRDVKWEGIPWRIAEDPSSGILWVLAPTRDMVEAHRPALTRLAVVCRDFGGLDNVLKELSSGRPVVPRAEGAKPRPKASNKRLTLNAVTEAVKDAYAAGATAQDVRLAVLSALGLDADVA